MSQQTLQIQDPPKTKKLTKQDVKDIKEKLKEKVSSKNEILKR